jgi:signal transduction histidine kinase
MTGWWILIGALGAGPVWVALTLWASRRVWRSARRLSARAKGRDHLVELGQLAGGLAHEIKNPLSTINVNLRLLAEDLARGHDERHRQWLRRLENVQQEAARLREILDDFLRYAGRYELEPRTVDLRALIGELTDFFAAQAEAAQVVVRTSLPDAPVWARVDPKLIKQAVLNLMLNAAQAMTEGGELLIRVSAQRGGTVVEVIDTGPGIPPDELEKIFEVYYSTKSGGTGLGLPTTRRIVRASGGSLRAQSEVGKGTRFVITLPVAPQPAAARGG